MITDRTAIRILSTVGLTFAGKLAGFLRIQQIASTLGASYYADALLLAFQLLMLVDAVIIANAVAPSLIARFYGLERRSGASAATDLSLHVFLISLAGSAVFGAVVALLSGPLASALAPGFGAPSRALFAELLLYGAITPLVLSGLHFLSLLNRMFDNGVWYSICQIGTNLGALAGLLAGHQLAGPRGAAIGMIEGLFVSAIVLSAIQWLVAPLHVRQRFARSLSTRWRQAVVGVDRATARGFWYGATALVAAAMVQEAYVYLDLAFASLARDGGVAILGYASRLALLANVLIVSSAFVILETRWAQAVSLDQRAALEDPIAPDVVSTLALVVPASVVLVIGGAEVAWLVYGSGNWSADDFALLVLVIQIYGAAIIGLGASLMLARLLNIVHRPADILWVNIVVLALKFAANWVLVEPYGLPGLAAATCFGALAQTVGYYVLLRRAGYCEVFRAHDIIRLAVIYATVALVTWLSALPFADGFMRLLAICFASSFTTVVLGVAMKLSFSGFVLAVSRRLLQRVLRREQQPGA